MRLEVGIRGRRKLCERGWQWPSRIVARSSRVGESIRRSIVTCMCNGSNIRYHNALCNVKQQYTMFRAEKYLIRSKTYSSYKASVLQYRSV
jgi:hypothetical protein